MEHKNIQDRMIDFILGFEEGFKKAMELNSNNKTTQWKHYTA